MTGKHRARLSAIDRGQLRLAIANGYYDHTADDRVAAVGETILEHHVQTTVAIVDQSYANGESSGYADWIVQVDDHLPADVDVTPSQVGAYLQVLHRECDVLAQALIRIGAYPLHYPRSAAGIRAWAHAHAVAGTTIEKDGD